MEKKDVTSTFEEKVIGDYVENHRNLANITDFTSGKIKNIIYDTTIHFLTQKTQIHFTKCRMCNEVIEHMEDVTICSDCTNPTCKFCTDSGLIVVCAICHEQYRLYCTDVNICPKNKHYIDDGCLGRLRFMLCDLPYWPCCKIVEKIDRN